MSTPTAALPLVALTPETGALVVYTGPKAEIKVEEKAKKSFINFNKKNILIGVGITLTALAVPAALFYFVPSTLLAVGSLALSMFSAQASVNATLALGASLVATGVAALVGSTIALASFINDKLTVRAAMKKVAAKIAPKLEVIAEEEKSRIIAQHDCFIERLQAIHQNEMAQIQAAAKIEPIVCVSPLAGAQTAAKEGADTIATDETAARDAIIDARNAAIAETKAVEQQPQGLVARLCSSSSSPSRGQVARAVGCVGTVAAFGYAVATVVAANPAAEAVKAVSRAVIAV